MARKKRDDGRYQVQVDLGLDQNGKRVRKYFYGKTLWQARERRDDWMAQQQATNDVRIAHDQDTVSDWCDYWIETYTTNLRDTTIKQKTYTIRQLKKSIGKKLMCEVLPADLQAFMNGYADCAKGTIENKFDTIKAVFDSAVENRVIQTSPIRGVHAPHGKKPGGHRAITKAEQALINSLWSECHAGLWAMVMMYTGMRRGEAFALQWEDVDLVNKKISIVHGSDDHDLRELKTDAAYRTVPIPDKLATCLETVKNRTGFVCGNQHNKIVKSSTYQNEWGKLKKKLGFDLTPHDLRYTYCTFLYEAGVDLKTAQYLMGHASAEMTLDVYTQLSNEKKSEGIEKLNKYLTAI